MKRDILLLTSEVEELSSEDLKLVNGGGRAAELVGYGIASGIAMSYFGIAGLAYTTYNFFS